MPLLHEAKGQALVHLSDYHEAIQQFSNAMELGLNTTRVHLNKGEALHRIYLDREAIDEFNIAIKINPNCIEAYNKKGAAYIGRGEYEEAINEFEHAIQLVNQSKQLTHKEKNVWLCRLHTDIRIYA